MKSSSYYPGLLYIVILVLAGCSKKKNQVVSGRVVYYTTHEPVPYFPMEIHQVWRIGAGYVGIGKRKKVASFTSDPNGEFSVLIDMKLGKGYEYMLNSTEATFMELDTNEEAQHLYYFKTPQFNQLPFAHEAPSFTEFAILPSVRIKAVVKDVFPLNDADELYVMASEVGSDDPKLIYSLRDGFTSYHFIPTDGKVQMKIYKDLNGFRNETTEIIEVVPFGKTVYHVNY